MVSKKMVELTWDQIHTYSKGLVRTLRALDVRPETVVAVTRGGFVPAIIVAHAFGIKDVRTVKVQQYGSDNVRGAMKVQAIDYIPDLESTVIVDDICDTGATMHYLTQLIPKAHRCAMVAKPLGRPHVQHVSLMVQQEQWVKFPWEV